MHASALEPRYTPPQAARLLGVTAATVRGWLRWSDAPEADDNDDGRLLASFLDLVEIHIAVELRKRFTIGTRALRLKLVEAAQLEKLDHPLARRRFLLDGSKLWLPLGDEQVVDLGAHGQLGLPEVIRQVAQNIDFDADEIAARWWPQGRDGAVIVDPQVCWGAPVIAGTRINTDVLFNTWRAEGQDTALIAADYGLTQEVVAQAVAFELDRRGERLAA